MVGAGEEVWREAFRRVVPNLGSVERQHYRFSLAPAQQHRKLREEPVAVHVDDVRAGDSRRQSCALSARREHGADAKRARE